MSTINPDDVDSSAYFAADLMLAHREARAGEPWEFIRLQWPHLVLKPDERKYFDSDFRLDRAQWDIIKYVFAPDHTECYIKGCTKYGKGYATAIAVNIWFDIWPDPADRHRDNGNKIILCGPSSEHVKNTLFAEVVSLRKQMLAPGPGEIQAERVRDHQRHFIVIANPKTGEGFSGQHSPHTLFVFDESSAIPDNLVFQARKQHRFIAALANPRILSGWFRKGFGDHEPDVNKSIPADIGMRRLITADGGDTVNVRYKRLEKPFAPMGGITVGNRAFAQGEPIPADLQHLVAPLIPAQIDYARYQSLMADPDENNRLIYGRGLFPKEDADVQIILGSWLANHMRAYSKTIPVTAFGLDVAASEHGDATVLAAGGIDGCAVFHERHSADVMEVVGWVLDRANTHGVNLTTGAIPIAVDNVTLGRGVSDRLREQGVWVIALNGNARSRMPNQYDNVRAELYGELARRLNPKGSWGEEQPWGLPDDPLLFEELCAHERVYTSDGIKIKLIPKEKPNPDYSGKTIKDKIGRSPDRSDALAYLWRAVSSSTDNSDYTSRSLVHTLEAVATRVETSEERRQREWNEHLERLCISMDDDYGSHFSHAQLGY